MKIKLTILVLFFATKVFAEGDPFSIYAVGPTVHYNLGNKEHHISLGMEGSYWYIFGDAPIPPMGFDFGVEYELRTNKIRLYSEVQTGAILGISSGLVTEFSKGNKIQFGFQGSAWLAYGIGFEYRYRHIGGTSFYSPGLFTKYPIGGLFW